MTSFTYTSLSEWSDLPSLRLIFMAHSRNIQEGHERDELLLSGHGLKLLSTLILKARIRSTNDSIICHNNLSQPPQFKSTSLYIIPLHYTTPWLKGISMSSYLAQQAMSADPSLLKLTNAARKSTLPCVTPQSPSIPNSTTPKSIKGAIKTTGATAAFIYRVFTDEETYATSLRAL